MAHNLSEPVRKEIFSALVEAQDQEMSVAQSLSENSSRRPLWGFLDSFDDSSNRPTATFRNF